MWTKEADPAPAPQRSVAGWRSWDEVPRDPFAVAAQGPFFVELFSGTARLTAAVRRQGVPCLPPIDITPCEEVPAPRDVVDLEFWDFFMRLVSLGAIAFLHCGTPCNTFSAARKLDGGPPPIRSKTYPLGLPQLSDLNQALVFLGNLFVLRTAEACLMVFLLGGDFSIENPLFSLIWDTPPMLDLWRLCRALAVDFDQCMFGAPSRKPTRLLVTSALFDVLAVQCSGAHQHVALQGQEWCSRTNTWIWKTKRAQVYPHQMCVHMAATVSALVRHDLSHLQPSFDLALTASERKRPLGPGLDRPAHRQANTAALAQFAGYQLKRGAAKPLIQDELEPGQAIAWAMSVPHPFTQPTDLPSGLDAAIEAVVTNPAQVISDRVSTLKLWEEAAHRLLPVSDQILLALPDPALRCLLRGVPDDQPAQLGLTCHVELYRAMLAACQSVDQSLPDFLTYGFPIIGPIARTGRWPDYTRAQPNLAIAEALTRAWELRRKIVKRVQAVPVSDNLQKIWDATLEDVQEGSTVGPFNSEEEVTAFLRQDDWIPTQRFEVVQKNKVRGCDSATTNMINQVTIICEKLQLPSTDMNIAAIRKLRSSAPWKPIGGWVLDERKAYRQVAIRPDHRKFSVICLKDPSSAIAKFFVMIGHSFGLVSAVYNYNRRSAAINEFLVSLFKLVAFSFYDDKYGFEPEETLASARLVAECVHTWLGARFDAKKLQLGRSPTILGVTYDLAHMRLLIKPDRKQELLDELDAILKTGLLDPGSAGKLKGKLMFGASQLWGKVGRAFLRVISERQYLRFPQTDQFSLGPALIEALRQWRKLIQSGPPRLIDLQVQKPADIVIFTDGFTPDPRERDVRPDRIGAVLFDRRLRCPLQLTALVPQTLKKKWLERATQIVPVEMVAPIVALWTFADRVKGADVILLIDSEAVEGALIKGYSSKSDLCGLVSIFWDVSLEFQARIFIDRISTDANPADWPSRGDLDRGLEAGWITVEPSWPPSLSS